jgi:hypothetical protein
MAAPAPTPVTHYCDWDAPGRRTVPALCGTYIRRAEHTNDPTCPRCRAGLAYRREIERREGIRP